jgi:hypothetical protein
MNRWQVALLVASLGCHGEPPPPPTVPVEAQPIPPSSPEARARRKAAAANSQDARVQVMVPESQREPPIPWGSASAQVTTPSDPAQESPPSGSPQESPPAGSPQDSPPHAPPAPPAPEGDGQGRGEATRVEQPAQDDVPDDPTDEERMRDESAYEQFYLRQKERLVRDQLGKWIAIASGRLLPADARGHVQPAASFEECRKAIDVAAPEALHRFVFRIGEEGDVVYADNSTQPRCVIGSAFKVSLGVTATFDARAMQMTWTRGPDRHAFELEQGLLQLMLSDPTARQSMGVRLSDSSGFDGFVLLDATTADLLDTEKFEIPGRALLKTGGDRPFVALRRARIRIALPELHLDDLIPAATWPH